MATLETRNAELDRAREALLQAVLLEPSPALYYELARIHRQLSKDDDARAAIETCIALAKKSTDLFAQIDAECLRFELESERGNTVPANQALREALSTAIAARDRARQPEEQAQAERRLARILELYGEYEGAKRAALRALDAARSNQHQRTATILDSARRALTYGDLRGARIALREALDSGVSGSDCVYVALWAKMVERRLRVASDGSVEEAMSRVGDVGKWPGRLRAWLLGNLSDLELERVARTEAEKTELKLYQALSSKESQRSEALIAEVANSRAIGLVEVFVAKDLVRLTSQRERPRWPDDIRIP
jgi:tetratricopeptide (TPR) repeat protein